MFSFPTWPRFPSVSLPATIQRRFLSFILKRTLGHLVKPGQLDPAQVDAQIGSGFIQVNDVELDHDAINEHLANLPLPFMLEVGSIGKVSARLPWPNLLTAPLSLSLSSLSLTFVYAPRVNTSGHSRKDDLAESVATIAESFVHDELSTGEGETLQQGLNIGLPTHHQPPGSIDPFLSTEDLDLPSQFRESDESDEAKDGFDPSTQGVSLIATLIERLLARFEFDASDIKVRLVLPRKAEFTLSLGQITYNTENTVDPSVPLPCRGVDDGEVRVVKLSGVTLYTRPLQPPSVPLSTTSRQRSVSPNNSSSSSDENDEIMMMMSQSLASLPPILPTPSASPESSMYHSATSSVRCPSPDTTSQTEKVEHVEEKILSLGQGSDSLVLRLVTPRLIVPSGQAETHDGLKNKEVPLRPHPENPIRLTVTIGPVAIALNPTHASSLLYLSSALTSSKSGNEPPNLSQPLLGNTLDVTCHIKCITFLLLRSPSPILTCQLAASDTLHDFFLARNNLSTFPRIPHLRAQFDVFEFSFTTFPSSKITSGNRCADSSVGTTTIYTHKQLFKASIADLSVFAVSTNTSRCWTVSPILVSDPNLPTQYECDTKFPSFDVFDWTKPRDLNNSWKVSQWRVRPSQSKRKSADVVPPSVTRAPRFHHAPAVKVRFESAVTGQAVLREVDVIPLHLFIDIGIVEGAIEFITILTVAPTFSGDGDVRTNHAPDMDETPPATPRARDFTGWQTDNSKKVRRPEDLVINDFTAHEDIHPSASTSARMNLAFRISFLRIEVRVPSPPISSPSPRSGVVVLDLHDVYISQQSQISSPNGGTRRRSNKRYETGPVVLGQLQCLRLLVAATLPGESTASTFLSIIGQETLSKNSPTLGINTFTLSQPPSDTNTIFPSICIRTNPIPPHRPSANDSPGVSSSISFDAHLPTVLVTVAKPVLDALTFWADDITQCLFGDPEHASDASGKSRDPSMIGSRFFARRTASTGSSESGREVRKSELVVKLSIGEAQISLFVPRKNEDTNARPLEVRVMDLDLLTEIKPEGRDETVVTVGIVDLQVCDVSATGAVITILQLTIPRDIVASSKAFIKLRYIGVVDNNTAAKESRLKLSISGFTYYFTPDIAWIADAGLFAKAPDGAFESVIPSERTKISIKVMDGSFHVIGPNDPGALVVYIGELDLSTDLVGDSHETDISATVLKANAFFIDDKSTVTVLTGINVLPHSGVDYWKQLDYALLAEVDDIVVRLLHASESPKNTQVHVDSMKLKLNVCADTFPAFGSFVSSLSSNFQGNDMDPSTTSYFASLNASRRQKRDVFAAVDEHAFKRIPDIGPAPDMIHDDLPTNLDYLDASFGAAAGLRELRDDDLFDFEPEFGKNATMAPPGIEGVISNIGGETIRMLVSDGIHTVEGHFENILQDTTDISARSSDTSLAIRVRDCDVTVSLYDGYDWVRTRRTIEQEVKAIRRRLVKIRQLLASGQTPDDSIEETSSILFNSVYIGLPQDPEDLEPAALIAAIDEELNDGGASESASQSSWQSFKPHKPHGIPRPTRLRGRRLERSRSSQIDLCVSGIHVELDKFQPNASLVSRTLVTVKDLEILDHIKTSTWKKFLTELRTDFRGNVRETGSDMVRGELRIVHPVPDIPTEEGRFRAKVLPIKLHVDQDALDFMKNFFSFENPVTPPANLQKAELYFQHVEVFPVDIKLDYKPKRVDYKALREGKTIELMNFFHFEGADITLRHITLSGITGWARLFDTLNDLWTPDVKANQLADIISGVSPVRSLVNVGSGVADLVLLPIAQYKKDKRLVRGVQKGTTSFMKSTAMEAIKLGARLATGTQVILEQAESVLGAQGQFKDTVTTEAIQTPHTGSNDEESEVADLISKYADQPQDVREGIQSAYKSLSRNFNSAAQTILAVPMEVYERSGNEGPVRAVVRAVPIAVLKPMIGASEAVSKTLFGLRNTMDPEVKHENEAKYKQR